MSTVYVLIHLSIYRSYCLLSLELLLLLLLLRRLLLLLRVHTIRPDFQRVDVDISHVDNDRLRF